MGRVPDESKVACANLSVKLRNYRQEDGKAEEIVESEYIHVRDGSLVSTIEGNLHLPFLPANNTP